MERPKPIVLQCFWGPGPKLNRESSPPRFGTPHTFTVTKDQSLTPRPQPQRTEEPELYSSVNVVRKDREIFFPQEVTELKTGIVRTVPRTNVNRTESGPLCKTRFIKPIFGHSARPTALDRAYRKQSWANILTVKSDISKLHYFPVWGAVQLLFSVKLLSGEHWKLSFREKITARSDSQMSPCKMSPLEPRGAAVAKSRSVCICDGNECSPSRCENTVPS